MPSWLCVWRSFEFLSTLATRLLRVTLAIVTGSELRIFVSDAVVLQYMGFESKGTVREYAFRFRGTDGASSEYFVTIANEAFVAHRVRYQDAPDICLHRLRREFAERTDHPPSTCFSVTDAELAAYKDAHTPKSKPVAAPPGENNES